ncbi:MBL fold metallo-hydrolase [Algoriphagus sp. A40]|uniref:MBL fold metallo-hydrolase n=1 Tax=Algoriphagus sp. A40 TaxID=1945863 RepID=UPI0011156881|nr:MBL fold metallo-hydrolase [Algoriphagus sp. A40]
MKKFVCLIWSIAFAMNVMGQNASTSQKKPTTIDPSLTKVEDEFMNRQSAYFLDLIEKNLHTHPPLMETPEARMLTLYMLDAVLHDKYAAYREPVQKFFHHRIDQALTEIENTKVDSGIKIWKLYNIGFIARTKSVTIAFDLVTGNTPEAIGFAIPDATMERIIKQCDVLFISHRHRDHAQIEVAQSFLDKGKVVVAPPQVWEGQEIHSRITHLKRESHTKQKLALKGGKVNLEVVNYPGHQMSSHENNVPLIYTPEGITIAHSGDQINEGKFMVDYDWIDDVHKHHQLDIFLVNNWTNDILRIAKGLNPKLIIPGHENELGHTFDDRVPYWGDEKYLGLEYTQLKQTYPVLLMVWGESFHYSK